MSKTTQINTPDGLSWYVTQAGHAANPPLILIPSGEGDSDVFNQLITHLSAYFHITTFDMPGYSRTTGPSALTDPR